jgi:hypothetical protein
MTRLYSNGSGRGKTFRKSESPARSLNGRLWMSAKGKVSDKIWPSGRRPPPGVAIIETMQAATKHAMLKRASSLARLDLAPKHRQPSPIRVVLAMLASILASLAADAIVVTIGQAIFSSTKGYSHFQFADYTKLTVIGVVIASAGWPVVTRITSAPRWLFLRLATGVTVVLWLPDLYIAYQGQPTDAIVVLMVMHVVIALVTYNLLVHVAAITSPDCQVGTIGPAASASRPWGAA